MRVLLDVSPIGSNAANRTGLARVSLALAHALGQRDDLEVLTCAWGSIYASDDFRKAILDLPSLRPAAIQPSIWERAYAHSYAKKRAAGTLNMRFVRLGQVLNRLRNPIRGIRLKDFDTVHSTYARFPPKTKHPSVSRLITVHDLTPFKLSKEMMPYKQAEITKRILDGISETDWVACVSEHTRNDFIEAYPHLEERAMVVPNGVDLKTFSVAGEEDIEHVRQVYGLSDRPFLMTLSSLAPHKNLKMILKVWPEVKAKVPDALLVIGGGKTQSIEELSKLLGIDYSDSFAGVILPGFIDDGVLPGLLSGSNAFLFPSLYEGFGLPVLEAMACGAPVIASNRSSIPEVYGSVGLGLDPEEPEIWREAMIKALESGPRRGPDIKARKQAECFSWAIAAERYKKVYERIQ